MIEDKKIEAEKSNSEEDPKPNKEIKSPKFDQKKGEYNKKKDDNSITSEMIDDIIKSMD